MHDPLTKLANRTFLYEWFKERKNAQKTQQFAVLFIDLDGFKKINDTFGHYIGDLFLEVIARRLEASVKKNDLVIRLGGDEFCIILNKMGNQKALLPVIQRLQDNLFTPLNVENITIYPKASIGVSIYPEDGQDILTLIKKADTAMYKAKGKGGGTYQLTQPSI